MNFQGRLLQASLFLYFLKVCQSLDLQGPIFIHEPPHRVEFSNNSGGHIECTGHGNPPPEIEWSPVLQHQDLVYALPNGSLLFYPFSAEKYRHEIHATVYRCKLRNVVGTILSREVHVKGATETIGELYCPSVSSVDVSMRANYPYIQFRSNYGFGYTFCSALPVVNQKYTVQVHDEYVMTGNTALLKCQVPTYMAEIVMVTSWVQDTGMHLYPNTDIGGKYVVLQNGDLYVDNVNVNDAHKSYTCRTVNRLTGETQSSAYPGRIIITEPKGPPVQPRILTDKQSVRYVAANGQIILPCIAQGHPAPTYRWFKEQNEQLTPIKMNERIFIVSGGLLKISKARIGDAGKYLCWVNNTGGEETSQVLLTILAPLTVHLQPQVQIVDVNKDATFLCMVSGQPVNDVKWQHNGKAISLNSRVEISLDPHRLIIKSVQKEDQGMYQCVVTNDLEQMQSTAELQLGDAPPELLYWFSEQTLQPGPAVSLKCVATGNPPPQFTWSLDGFAIPDSSRFLVGQYVTVHDDVISHVNITNVKSEDGGEYTCTAQNSIGKVMHSAKVNIYGPPYIREMPRITGISGFDLVVKCPVAGYPIEKIHWERDGHVLPMNRRQRVYVNGTMVLEQVQRSEDVGTYTCMAQNKDRATARRNVEFQVLVPPKIMPIQAMTNLLREGMRAAISCQLLEGDLPVSFRWERNGKPVLGTGNEVIRRIDEYSASLVIEHISSEHSGNYTCIASNVAGTEKFHIPLTVNVPPKWVLEPKDVSVHADNDVELDCQAGGYPQPTITWKRAIHSHPGDYKDFLYEPNVNIFPNGSLLFNKISKEFEGHYLCEAKNTIGSGVSKVVFLKVNVAAHFATKEKQIFIARGKQVHIQCNAQGDTPIDLKWRMQNSAARLDGSIDSRYSIREQLMDKGMVSELGISHTYRQDNGVYICQASNAFGQDEMTIHLTIQEVPEPPKNLRVNSQQSRNSQLSWSTPFSGNSAIEEYHIQYKLLSDVWQKADRLSVTGSHSVITLQNLKPAQTYQIRLTAENKLGSSEFSEVLQMTTLEEVPSGPPRAVKGEARSSTEIFLTWEPPDRSEWNGQLLGYYVGYQMVGGKQQTDMTQGYSFQTVEIRSQFGGETILGNLNKFTQYHIVVQAYTSQGSGPPSEEISVSTWEDVPSSAPENPKCDILSSTSLYITWSPPILSEQNGKIRGYKVTVVPVENRYEHEPKILKSNNQYLTIENLKKFTNYSVSVTAHTKIGDGLATQEMYCRTSEDVPSAPYDIKAIPASSSKIIVSWVPPVHRNGQITSYTFYMSMIEGGRDEGTHKRTLGPHIEIYEAQRLQEDATYQFWVTASTRIGEGEKSKILSVPPNNKVPARIISFSKTILSPWKQDLSLPCRKVGIPAPVTIWRQDSNAMDTNLRKTIAKNGTIFLRHVQQSDAGNYTCSVENIWGKDEIVYHLVVKMPPDPPRLTVSNSFADSLLLEWVDTRNGGSAILGYVINYKRDNGDWEELQIDSKTNSHLLGNLWCGSRYQLYITAINMIGTGLPCDIVNSFTKGSVPIQPKPNQFLTTNSTSITCWLDSWTDGGCAIAYFVIEYRILGRGTWSSAGPHVTPTDRIYSIGDLIFGTKYELRVTANNNAGATVAIFNATTLNPNGVIYSQNHDFTSNTIEKSPFGNVKVLLPVIFSIVILAILIATVLFVRKKKSAAQNRIPTSSVSESSITTAAKTHRDQYLAMRCNPTNDRVGDSPGDSGSYKAGGNEYVEDICPYATFQLNKQTYSESSYSGNVYSGPYHSVRGSFVYHDVKTDTIQEPEYTKVRRKGGRLRDPHSESQESDKGSTDSEVRKILTLHIPITEYDTLGSESDTQIPAAAAGGAQSQSQKYRSQRENQEETSSSSSANSPTSVSRKQKPPYPNRKGANLGKRHVRSSSGYSSQNEDTTFSISNIPNYQTSATIEAHNIHPPHRFLDSSHNKKTGNSPRIRLNQKLQRETFQINV